MLRACAEQLTGIFRDIFNLSLAQAAGPTCFKTASIVHLPKHSNPTCLNDYHPVAHTPIIMKCFERLVLAHLKNSFPPTLDPHQFAYRSNRSIDDAISTALHCVLSPFFYTSSPMTAEPSNSIIKFADDTKAIGLISNNDEAAYREEVQHLATWCTDYNLLLNTSNTKEIIVDFRKKRHA